MIFKKIRLKEGMEERIITFSQGNNLIYSSENSCGKTTLLRLILYSLGYDVPATKKIKFEKCEVEVELVCENIGDIILLRYSKEFIISKIDGKEHTYILPDDLRELHSKLFNTNNEDILNNLLGAFYVDQEKGWTLLNRGKVIGSIDFKIEELVRGLSNNDCSELIIAEKKISGTIEKYNQIFNIAKYRDEVQNKLGDIPVNTYNEEILAKISKLRIEENILKNELKEIEINLKDSNNLKRYIKEMKILIRGEGNEIIPVTEDNIIGLNDNVDFLYAKRKIVVSNIHKIRKSLKDLESEEIKENEQLKFYKTDNIAKDFDENILMLKVNSLVVKKEIEELKVKKKKINDEINKITKENNSVKKIIQKTIEKYMKELGIEDKETLKESYMFTSNLKELSGAVLHKSILVFRLAYINAIESILKIKLPIILDSPYSKEMDENNINSMMRILERDYSDHQIIIASIYEYGFEEVNKIKIKKVLIDGMNIQ